MWVSSRDLMYFVDQNFLYVLIYCIYFINVGLLSGNYRLLGNAERLKTKHWNLDQACHLCLWLSRGSELDYHSETQYWIQRTIFLKLLGFFCSQAFNFLRDILITRVRFGPCHTISSSSAVQMQPLAISSFFFFFDNVDVANSRGKLF